jgi:hypothetical protein
MARVAQKAPPKVMRTDGISMKLAITEKSIPVLLYTIPKITRAMATPNPSKDAKSITNSFYIFLKIKEYMLYCIYLIKYTVDINSFTTQFY